MCYEECINVYNICNGLLGLLGPQYTWSYLSAQITEGLVNSTSIQLPAPAVAIAINMLHLLVGKCNHTDPGAPFGLGHAPMCSGSAPLYVDNRQGNCSSTNSVRPTIKIDNR